MNDSKTYTKPKKVQVVLIEEDLINQFDAEVKKTGMKESQLIRFIVTKYFYNKQNINE